MNICELKASRVRRGFSQKSFARALGMTQSRYGALETERARMTVEDANIIADTLGMTGADILMVFFDRGLHANDKLQNEDAHGDTTQSHVDGSGVVKTVCILRFGVKLRLIRNGTVNQKPRNSVRYGGLAEAVRPVDVGVLTVEVDGQGLNCPEILQGQI